MELYLIRHSEAVELNNEIVDDSYRYLSHSGRQKTIDVAHKLKELKVGFDCIITSPLVRAVQTAELFANTLNHRGEFKTAIELIGGNTFTRFLQLLKRNSHHKRIAFVGHAPDINNFAIGLLGKNDQKELKINFKNTSVCKVEYDLNTEVGKFVWFLKSDTMEIIKD